MAGSFSLVEKLAVAGAFCAIVALAVGTEDDPGVIADAQADAGQVVPRPAPDQESSSNYWTRSGDAPADAGAIPSPQPVIEENLPPGFGATPPPELDR